MPDPLVSELPVSEYALWNDFAAAHPDGDLLQSTAWGDLKAASGWKPSVLAIRDGSVIRNGMMLLRRSLPLGRSIFYAPRGPVADWNDVPAVVSLLEGAADYARKNGGILLKIDPPWEDEAAAEILRNLRFRFVGGEGGMAGTQPRCVMQLDLQRPLDEVMASFHEKWRYNIRLAGRKGVSIRISEDKSDLKAFYDILKVTSERDRFLVRDISYFEKMWDVLVPNNWMRLFLGEVEGETVCGALSYLFGDKCWYTYGASSNAHRNKMPNHLMQWEMIQWAHGQGCRWYDFRGVSCTPDDPDDPTAGLNRFKQGFNPRFVKYIGEYDLPLSTVGYAAWTKGLPKAKALMKRRAATASED
jgi:peptidoglycan pentaglycine glycine transferase (the first glycine)